MKSSYLLLLLFVACQSTTRNLGEQFVPKNPVTMDAVLQQLPASGILKDVQIDGKIEKSCMSEGCWFTIKDVNGKEVLFDVKDKKFKVPINSPGKEVIALADISRDTSKEQPISVEVRGLRFK